MKPITITLYKWKGEFFPFTIKTHCGECSLNENVIQSVKEELEQEGISIHFEIHPWLDNWYKVLFKGGYHAPIILVNDKIVKQEEVISREELKIAIIKEYVKGYKVGSGVEIYTLPNCKFCKSAKKLLDEKGHSYIENEVVNNSLNMQKMLHLVKGKLHPITLPQVFVDRKWIGGYEELSKFLKDKKSK